jgi:hypothetical protein
MANRQNQKKRDITLMTVLAYESTKEAQALLKKYGREPGKGYADLEVKLANLYFDTPDKVQLEKEMAQIHPHKKWILENTEPLITVKQQEVEIEAKPDEETLKQIEELKKQLKEKDESQKLEDLKNEMKKAFQEELDRSQKTSKDNLGGNPFYSPVVYPVQASSSFAGDVDRTANKEKVDNMMPYVTMIGVVGILSIAFIAVYKATNK